MSSAGEPSGATPRGAFPGAGGAVLERVLAPLAAAPRRLLLLDYDGTLAPFTGRRMDALLPGRTRGLLERLAVRPDVSLVVISGRPLDQLGVLAGGLHARLVGEHGWEEMDERGRRTTHTLPGTVGHRLGLAVRAADALGWRDLVERKRCSVVLHLRGLDAVQSVRLTARCRAEWGVFFARDGLELTDIAGGLELRATARNKGTAALEQLAREPPGTLPLCIGDDVTDEDAFRALGDHGVTIRVGGSEGTAAHWTLHPGDVVHLLERLVESPAGPAPSAAETG